MRGSPKRARRAVRWVLAWVELEKRLLLTRRPPVEGLSDGLWGLPGIEIDDVGDLDLVALARRFQAAHGGRWSLGRVRGRARHTVTHRDIELVVVEASVTDDGSTSDDVESFAVDEIDDLPRTAVLRKALAAARPQGSASVSA